MAGAANASKVFNFSIEVDGMDEFYVQEVKMPEIEVGVVEHGATNHNIKTAGGVGVSAAELKKIKPINGPDAGAWAWLNQAQDMNTGTGQLETAYKKNIIFKELGTDGSIINAWMWVGAWCSKLATSDFKRGKQDENVIETATIQVDRVVRL